nr:MAG TPA: hypothetical protein [Caudoviricetes sp.]
MVSKIKNSEVSIFTLHCCPFYTLSPLSATAMVAIILF